jgi:hypothetical protein
MAVLREFGCARGNLGQGAARACNGASQLLDEHPWCPKAHALAVLFLPACVGNFLQEDRVAHGHDLMGLFALQTLAMSSQFALFFRFGAPGLLIALALLPRQLLLGSLLDATCGVIVVGIGARRWRSIFRCRRWIALS